MFTPSRGVDDADIRYATIANSVLVTVGCTLEAIAGATPLVKLGTTNNAVLGVALGIVGNKGKVLELNSKTVASDNQTVALIKVAYIPAWLPITYVSDLDAAAGTTSNSGGIAHFNVDTTGLLTDESTVQLASTASTGIENMQVESYGLTGKNTTEVEVRFINTGVGYNIA